MLVIRVYLLDRRALFDGSTSVVVGRSGASPDLVFALSSQLSLAFSGSRPLSRLYQFYAATFCL